MKYFPEIFTNNRNSCVERDLVQGPDAITYLWRRNMALPELFEAA